MKSQSYFLAILVLLCISSVIRAQRSFDPHPVISPPAKVKSTGRTSAAACDTINYSKGQSWSYAYYLIDEGNGGYVAGNNVYNEKQKAAFFTSSATDNFLSKVWIAVYKANSQVSTHLDKVITVNVYDGSNNSPGRLLAARDLKLKDFKVAARDEVFLEVNFTPVTLPASKKFFVSVDFSTLEWPADTLCLFSNADGESAGNAWEETANNQWEDFGTGWGLGETALHIYPFVSNSSNGCTTSLPLKLVSFTAERKSGDITINWDVTNESNMQRYELERSLDNLHFTTVYSAPALNLATLHSYNFTDKEGASSNTNALFYRLKQINTDGSFSYSNIIAVMLNNKAVTINFQNPFSSNFQINIQTNSAQKAFITLYDLLGRYTGISMQSSLSSGVTTIDLTNASSLAKGTYIADIFIGGKHYPYKVVKN